MADIWSGVNFGNSIINPGSVFQSYNPGTGQTTYGNPTPGWSAGMAAGNPGGLAGPAVATPAGTPAGAQVYQSAKLGYAPSGPNTNFTTDQFGNTNSPFARNPSAFPDIKTASSLNPNELKESQNTNSLLKAQNDALKAQQANDKAGGIKQTVMDTFNKNPNGIANNAFIQAVAQAAYNRPATADELQKGGQFGLQGLSISEVVRRFGLAPEKPGATEYPPTQVDPAPEIATDDGLIDLQKAIADFESKLVAAQNEEIQAQANLDTFTNETQRGVAAIGDQLGRTATLVQGEQWSLKQQRQADEDLLVKRLGLAEKKKSNVIEQGRLKMEIEQKIYDRKRQIVEDARKLRKDQQDILASSFEMMLKYGIGADKNGNFSPSTLKLVNDFSASTGIPAKSYLDMLNAAFDDKLNAGLSTTIQEFNGRKVAITLDAKGNVVNRVDLGASGSGGGGGGGNRGSEEEVEITFDSALTDTANYLANLRNSGKLSDLNYSKAVRDFMSDFGIPDEQKGQVESEINNLMQGGSSTQTIQQDNNPTSDFFVDNKTSVSPIQGNDIKKAGGILNIVGRFFGFKDQRVGQLQSQYPDAGITKKDTYNSAIQKVNRFKSKR